MAATRYFIELQVNFDDALRADKEELLKVAAARMSKGLLSTAMLLQDRSRPKLSMTISDNINGDREVDLAETNTDGPCPTCGHDDEYL
jgi:hypothetical protein